MNQHCLHYHFHIILVLVKDLKMIVPQHAYVRMGETVQFQCTQYKLANAESSSYVPQWYHTQTARLPRNSVPIYTGETLTIKYVGSRDRGFYYCHGYNARLDVNFWAYAQLEIYGNELIIFSTGLLR